MDRAPEGRKRWNSFLFGQNGEHPGGRGNVTFAFYVRTRNASDNSGDVIVRVESANPELGMKFQASPEKIPGGIDATARGKNLRQGQSRRVNRS
ncbi:MAG: hypothetical protein OXN84_21480 [Albidovulum sp.]|nr:hypothetical protein [Albidovulum sp.]